MPLLTRYHELHGATYVRALKAVQAYRPIIASNDTPIAPSTPYILQFSP